MAFDLNSIKKSRVATAVTMTLTGPSKIGKTTTVANLRNSIGILTEDGARHVDGTVFPLATSLQDVYDAMKTLLIETHDYEVVWLDSLDWLEPLLNAHVCKQNNWSSIEAAGYGKGYVAAAAEYKEGFLAGVNALRQRGLHVILLAHDKIKPVDSPVTDKFDAFTIKINDKLAALTTEFCDVLAYANYKPILKQVDTGFGNKELKAVNSGERILHLQAHPAMPSGNRLGWSDVPLSTEALQQLLDAVKPPINEKKGSK